MTSSAALPTSIEYSHVYTHRGLGQDHAVSAALAKEQLVRLAGRPVTTTVMVDDYSYPDPSFNYQQLWDWLAQQGLTPDLLIRESQLIPDCDVVVGLLKDGKLKRQLIDYVRTKKYPCSLFVAAWYLIRLGYITSDIFKPNLIAGQLINILPDTFADSETKALKIIAATPFAEATQRIEHIYFAGHDTI